jgi:hypothetical protein
MLNGMLGKETVERSLTQAAADDEDFWVVHKFAQCSGIWHHVS